MGKKEWGLRYLSAEFCFGFCFLFACLVVCFCFAVNLLVFFFFETCSHGSQASLKFTVQLIMALNF